MPSVTQSQRRHFLRQAAGLGISVLGGGLLGATSHAWLSATAPSVAHAADTSNGPSPEARLKQLDIELPKVGSPIATFVPCLQVGDLLYVSGHIARRADGSIVTGKVGSTLTLEEGQAAARVVALELLANVRAQLGTLDRVVRLVKTFGMVNSAPDFYDQPKVINGFSDLLVEIFGPHAGKGVRSAVGMVSLPLDSAVEVEAVFQVR